MLLLRMAATCFMIQSKSWHVSIDEPPPPPPSAEMFLLAAKFKLESILLYKRFTHCDHDHTSYIEFSYLI